MPDDKKKDPVTAADVAAGVRDARGAASTVVQIDPKTGKAVPVKEYTPPVASEVKATEEVKPADSVEKVAPPAVKSKPTPAVDPDADSPDDGLATKMAKAKRRKAKAAGQTAVLK